MRSAMCAAAWFVSIAVGILVSSADLSAQRESRQARLNRLQAEVDSLERRREIVKQRVQDLMRRRIAHDLLVPIAEDELLKGIPAGDPMQREALEKTLASEAEKSRKLAAELNDLKKGVRRVAGAKSGSPGMRPDQIPAGPGGSGLTNRVPDAVKGSGPAIPVSTEPESISAAERRFDMLPLVDTEERDEYLQRALPFAFDEVERAIPTVETIVRTAPTTNVLRRSWTLIRAGMNRRALEVIRSSSPDEDERPHALRFLEARALEGLDLTAEAESIYAKIVGADLVQPDIESADGGESAGEEPGPWARASQAALDAIRFGRRFPVDKLPKTAGLRW